MPHTQIGPPHWIWERPPDLLKWKVIECVEPQGPSRYELRLCCGLQILSVHNFSREELWSLVDTASAALQRRHK